MHYIYEALYRINEKIPLGEEVAYKAFLELLLWDKNKEKRDVMLGSFLTGLFCNGSNVAEVDSLLRAIADFEGSRFLLDKIRLDRKVSTIIGSGKKWLKTFNISSAAALVAASCGVTTVKIGSSATSSITWSMDILRYFWADLDIGLEKMSHIIKNSCFWFISIEDTIPKFDKVYWGKFYAPHILSYILPALISPLFLDNIVYWLSCSNLKFTQNLFDFYKIPSYSIVNSTPDNIHFIDEISALWNSNIIRKHKWPISEFSGYLWEILWLPSSTYDNIKQWSSPEENSQKFLQSITDSWDIQKNYTVALNAAEILLASWHSNDYEVWFNEAMKIILSGKPLKLLKEFVRETWGIFYWNYEI